MAPRRLLSDPKHLDYRAPPRAVSAPPLPRREDPLPPYTVREVQGGPAHILARDGWSIVATVHCRPDHLRRAQEMALAGELAAAARKLLAGDPAGLATLRALIAKLPPQLKE